MYQLREEVLIQDTMENVWKFFATPFNLQRITPPDMGFVIKTPVPDEMYEGLIIAYTVRPIFGIPTEWVTEITHIRRHEFFVDEQRIGPYAMWHHEHHFKQTEQGILVTDIVSYQLPLAPFGNFLHSILIKPRLQKIFSYRTRVIKEIFKTK